MCQQHPLPKSPLTSSHVPVHQQKSSPQTQHSPTAVIPLIMSTKQSLSSTSSSSRRAALSPPLTGLTDSPTHASPSSTAADTPGTTQTFGAKLTVDTVSSIANYPSAELDTPSVKRAATLRSELAIVDLAKDVANQFLHGGLTYLIIGFLSFFI